MGTVTTEETRADARAQLRTYRTEEPNYPHRIKVRRVPVEVTTDGR